MLNSVNHLNAEADYRRELLSRNPLDTAEHFNLEPAQRTVRSMAALRPSFLAMVRMARGLSRADGIAVATNGAAASRSAMAAVDGRG
jgi:hypothetical protein